MRRTMAFDQSSRVTGYAVFDNKKLVTFGHFSIPANLTLGERLKKFRSEMVLLLEKYHPEKVYFEGIQYQSNAETFKKLAMIQGLIYYWCTYSHIPHIELAPSHWRSILKDKYNIKFGRFRAEQKQQAQNFVNKEFNIKATEDEADAICLGLAGIIEDEHKQSPF